MSDNKASGIYKWSISMATPRTLHYCPYCGGKFEYRNESWVDCPNCGQVHIEFYVASDNSQFASEIETGRNENTDKQ